MLHQICFGSHFIVNLKLLETKFSWFCPCCKILFEFVFPLRFYILRREYIYRCVEWTQCWFYWKWSLFSLLHWDLLLDGIYFPVFTVWFLNQYHIFISFNHNYSDTWLSSWMDTTCFYHFSFLFFQSKSRKISFTVSYIKTTSWFWLFFFFLCLD